MPITVTYGPISAALELAQTAGQGEGQWMRHQAGQDVLRRINQEARTALALRGQQASEALAYDRLAQQERLAQERLAQGQAEFAAQQALSQAREQRQAQAEARQQESFQMRQAQAAREQAQREAFAQQFGMPPEQFSAALQQRAAQRLEGAEQRRAEGAEERRRQQMRQDEIEVMERTVRNLEAKARLANRDFERYQNVMANQDWSLEGQQEKQRQAVIASQEAQQARAEYDAYLREMGQEAAENVLQSRQGPETAASPQELIAALQEEVQTLLPMFLGRVPRSLTTEPQIREAVLRAGGSLIGQEHPELVDLLVQAIMERRGLL